MSITIIQSERSPVKVDLILDVYMPIKDCESTFQMSESSLPPCRKVMTIGQHKHRRAHDVISKNQLRQQDSARRELMSKTIWTPSK